MKLRHVALSVMVVALVVVAAQADDESAAIKSVVEKAYVFGVHIDGDAAAFRAGFHPAFIMFVQAKDGAINKTTAEEWAANIEKGAANRKADAPKPKVEYTIDVLNQTGTAAVAKVELSRDGKHIFTDFLSLYKMADGWKIVGKIYYRHP